MDVETERYCTTCKEKKPIERFEFQGSQHLHRRYQCMDCRQQVKRGLIENKAQRKLREELLATFQQAARGSDVAAFGEYLESMMAMFGGPMGVAQTHFDCLQVAINERPGSKATLDAFRDFIKLWQQHDAGNKETGDFAGLSSEEIEKRLMSLAKTVFQHRGLQLVSDDDSEVADARVG